MKLAALLFAALALAGCSASFEEARDARIMLGAAKTQERDPYHCKQLDDQRTLFTDAAWVDGSLAGASGAIAGALPSDTPNGWRIGLGASAAAFGAMAVYAVVRANDSGAQWVRDCGDIPTAASEAR